MHLKVVDTNKFNDRNNLTFFFTITDITYYDWYIIKMISIMDKVVLHPSLQAKQVMGKKNVPTPYDYSCG